MSCLKISCKAPLVVAFASLLLFAGMTPAVDIISDGGNGTWNDLGSGVGWNGGQDAIDVLGTFQGLESHGAAVGTDVFINSGNVSYDPNIFGDFHFNQAAAGPAEGDYNDNGNVDAADYSLWLDNLGASGGPADGDGSGTVDQLDYTYWKERFGNTGGGFAGTLNLSGGATWSHNSNSDVDGKWTTIDAAELNIDGAGTTFRRTKSGASTSGGAFILGSWKTNSTVHPVIEVNLTDGGTIENDGQLWFGAVNDSATELEVKMTIDGGHLDLTGGDSLALSNDQDNTFQSTDLSFIHNFGRDETYSINFTGPGSITVDHSGIAVLDQNLFGGFDGTEAVLKTYEDLWDLGILQSNGTNGLDNPGETFGDFFSVTGSSGTDDYILTSLLGGLGVGSGSVTIPEPASILLTCFASLAFFSTRQRR